MKPEFKTRTMLLLLALFWMVAYLTTLQFRRAERNELAPMWDSLRYQTSALEQAHGIHGGSFGELRQYLGSREPEGFQLGLMAGYLLLGLDSDAGQLVAGLFGAAALVAFYLLATALGASPFPSLIVAAFWALSPNFLYQNFFETRNDYALAAALTLAWVVLLRAERKRSLLLWFAAGAMVGVATLLKMSAPGYAFWGVSLFSAWSVARHPWREGLAWLGRALPLFALGFLAACGWHYLPGLKDTLHYYAVWSGQMGEWQARQYGLQGLADRWMFYPLNFWRVHLSGVHAIALVIPALLAVRLSFSRFDPRVWNKPLGRWREGALAVMLGAAVVPIVFLTVRGSFASIADIPSLPILLALTAVFFSDLFGEPAAPRPWKRIALGALLAGLPAFALYGALQRPAYARQLRADQRPFVDLSTRLLLRHGLHQTRGDQVFSHPNLGVEVLRWHLYRQRPFDRKPVLRSGPLWYDDGENLDAVFRLLCTNQFLLLTETPMIPLGGEVFSTLNQHQATLTKRVRDSGLFLPVDSFTLPESGALLELWVKKNHACIEYVSPNALWSDGWIEWGTALRLQAMRPGRLAIHFRAASRTEFVLRDGPMAHAMEITTDSGGGLSARSAIIRFSPGETRTLTLELAGGLPEGKAPGDTRRLALLRPVFSIVPE